ncbi:hypothetical protein FRACYDRAFT_250954 [Fragilariopsis cylindrus CCMP1102]|uniref:Uncharacterized protein n=1 Tax=Fragilariopsis cylindrus CCMP1102 TaxID=635003 RepID=A0A1E7ENM7_9STRA|nr:hypothetical protein FRACYDRAFT_250954 [Fragilariopsis cylindrus CCMP1102]|eukprot:OEU07531.1 hypothetical protein FRACYDRAFT_250954 [Fragilariopsis cylindrus CCMP1102]
MNNNKSSSRGGGNSVTTNSNRNENDDNSKSTFDPSYVRLDKNKVHPLAYILRISRYGKFMTKLSNELVQNIKRIDKEVSDMQRMMEQKGMKQSSRTGMAWVRRIESKIVEIKSLKTSLTVLPNILKIEESNKKKYMLLITWQRSFNLDSLDDDDDDDNGDDNNDKEGIHMVEEEKDEDHNRNTRKKKKAKNMNKDMSTIIQDDLPFTSEKIQNFIGDYYCLCSGCQTMYNKQYKHLFGSYESHIGKEDMTATGKFFCVDCWNYYLNGNGKKKHVDGLKGKENNNNNNNNSNTSSSDNNSKNYDDDIILSSTTATKSTENGSIDGIDDISSQQHQPTKKARKKKKKKKKKKANNDDDDDDGDGNQKEDPFIGGNVHNINTNQFEVDDTSQQNSEKTTSKNSSDDDDDDDEPLIKQHVAFSNNDKWVDFLLQTGSIIALNDYMDEILGVED